jgi:site-specific DNA recombinase
VKSTIHELLGNPFFVGRNRWMGHEYEGKQDPIISEDLFSRVQAMMHGKTTPKYSKHNPLFKAIIRCGECEGVITWQTQKGHWYGRCNGYRGCTKRPFVRQEELEQQLVAVFDSLASPSPAIIDWVKDALREKHQSEMGLHHATSKQLQDRHAYLRRRIDIMYDDRVDGRISPEKYDQKVKEAEDEQKSITSKLGNLDEGYMAQLERGISLLEISQHAAEIYASKPDSERRALLRDIFSNLSLNGQTLGYEYSPLVAAIAVRAEKQKTLNKKFEQADLSPIKRKEALTRASRSLWLRRSGSNRRPIR